MFSLLYHFKTWENTAYDEIIIFFVEMDEQTHFRIIKTTFKVLISDNTCYMCAYEMHSTYIYIYIILVSISIITFMNRGSLKKNPYRFKVED